MPFSSMYGSGSSSGISVADSIVFGKFVARGMLISVEPDISEPQVHQMHQYITVHHGASRCITGPLLWCIMVHHSAPWYAKRTKLVLACELRIVLVLHNRCEL